MTTRAVQNGGWSWVIVHKAYPVIGSISQHYDDIYNTMAFNELSAIMKMKKKNSKKTKTKQQNNET